MSENNILSEANENIKNQNEIPHAMAEDSQEQLQSPEYVLADESLVDCRCVEMEFPVEKNLFYRLILLALSALLLAFSFLPFAYIKADVGKKNDEIIPFNSVDSVKILFSSLQNISDTKLMESDEFKELEMFYLPSSEEFYFARLDGIKLNSAVKKATLFNLTSKNSSFFAGYILAAAVSVGYFITCLVFFITSAASVILEISKNKQGKHDTDKLFNTSIVLLWTVFLLVPLLGFSLLKMCYFTSGLIPAYTVVGRGLGVGFFLSLILSGVFSVIAFVKLFRKLKRKHHGHLDYKSRNGFLSCGLAILLALTVFLPALTVRFNNDSYTQERSFSTSVIEMEELDKETMKSYLKVSRVDSYNSLFRLRDEAMRNVKDKDSFFDRVYNTLIIGYRRMDVSPFHIAVILITALIFFSAALTVIFSLRNVFFNSVSSAKLNFVKILSFAAAVANSVFLILISQNASGSAVGNLVFIMSCELGIAPILMMLSGLLLVVSIRKPKKLKVIDKEYDNPDVSYAPYVLSDK